MKSAPAATPPIGASGPLAAARAAAVNGCVRHWIAIAGFALVAGLIAPRSAAAEQDHTVQRGQTWSGIARSYGVSAGALAAANRTSPSTALREGAVVRVPSRGEVFVGPGESLIEIARRHDASVEDLARANGLQATSQLRAGQQLALPGHARGEGRTDRAGPRAGEAAEKKWGRPKKPGTVTLMRLYPRQTRRVSFLDTHGRVRRNAIADLTQLMRPKDSRKRKPPHPRLVRLLAQVSDHFGGRPLHIISGYRLPGGNTKDSSQHVAGHALDFRIPGVPLETLRSYCAQLQQVGVGLYPRSKFVHLDVRKRDARWTDWSLPGQAAVRMKPSGEGAAGVGAASDDEAHDADAVAEPEAEVEDEAPTDDGSAELSDEP